MKRCSDYVNDAKERFGDPRMSERELGERLGGYSQTMISSAKRGNMSDPLALKLAGVLGIQAGEILMVARLEREKDPAVRAALTEWAGNVFALLPQIAPRREVVRGGRRVGATIGQNRSILPALARYFRPAARRTVSGWHPSWSASSRAVALPC